MALRIVSSRNRIKMDNARWRGLRLSGLRR